MHEKLTDAPFYNVIVVGGGTSGLMAAINAAENGADVLVIDKNRKLGKKLLLTGGTRCNVTNRTSKENLIKHIPGNGKFLYGPLNQFNQEDIIDFFESRGVELKEEDHGRMFPVTDKSQTILTTLMSELENYNVDIMVKSPVQEVLYDRDNQKVEGILTEDGEYFRANSIVLAVGGKSYPKTGTTGDGYAWVKNAGHTITRLYATEVPLLSDDWFIKEGTLQGVPLRDVTVTVWDDEDKSIIDHNLDMIFTHFGYSGPAILRSSSHVNDYLYETKADFARLSVDIQPELSIEELKEIAEGKRDKQAINILKEWMPESVGKLLLQISEIPLESAYKQIDHKKVDTLFGLIKHFPFTAHGTKPIEKGYVTGGGVNTKEINPKSMESKIMSGLYFCGEFIDINGYTGGYNITAAFVTGTIAGRNAAWSGF